MKASLVILLLCCCSYVGAAEKSLLPKKFNMVSRADWGAEPAKGEMKEHKPSYITIHHTGTPQKPARSIEDKLRGLQKFSQSENTLADGKKKAAWPDVPYHFYIAADGQIAQGREIQFVGDTNTEYDPTGHLLVTLEGNFENEKPTEAQMETTRAVVKFLAKKYKVPAKKIGSHKDYAKTACPGENLQSQMDELRALVK